MTTNPYQPPTTEIRDNVVSGEGGTLQDGIDGNYDFEIMEVLKEAWHKTYGVKWILIAAALIVLLISGTVGFVLTFIMSLFGLGEESIVGTLLSQLILMVVIFPFLAGIMMIGVRRSVELPVSFSMVFGYFGYVVPIIIAALLISILTTIGFILLILPGIYLSMAYFLAIPLIVEKKLGAWEAMEASRKAITHHWFKVFFTYFLMSILYVISIIPLGIGLIWTMPMMVNIGGILYRTIFGVEEALQE
jgi:hypothetical protein